MAMPVLSIIVYLHILNSFEDEFFLTITKSINLMCLDSIILLLQIFLQN